MLKLVSVYPSRKRVSPMLMPEHAAFSKTIGTGLEESHNSHNHFNCSQEPRDCTESVPWPGRTQDTVTDPPTKLRNAQSWWAL